MCKAIDMKTIFFCSHVNKTHFHNKGFALSLILKVRVFGTQKPPIIQTFKSVRNNITANGMYKCNKILFLHMINSLVIIF